MKITVVQGAQLTAEHIASWSRLLRENRDLDSPYFRPEFTGLVASVRSDVEVGVLHEHGQAVGFFPFQRFQRRLGRPVGGRLSDFQAVITGPETQIDARRLVRGCGLAAWDFDHLLLNQKSFESSHWTTDVSPYMDLSGGFERYLQRRRSLGDQEVKQTLRKARKIQREVGPLRLEFQTTDPDVLATLIRWKSKQYRRTRITDVFSFPWTVRLLERLLQHRDESFAGVLSALYAGDHLIAAHLGMRSHGVLHYWFPAYDPQFSKYSPGRILVLEIARASANIAVQRFDLGRGLSTFKKRFMTASTELAVGSVDLRSVSRTVRRRWRQTRDWLRQSPLRGPARVPARVLYHVREWMEFR